MIDFIWLVLFLVGIVTAMFTGNMSKVADAIIHGSERGVTLSIGLISVIALWLGLMNIAERAGAIAWLSKLLRPVARFLFPSVPADHPAMGAILANMSANLLGIGNAATPLGLKAMHELQTLNPDKDTASDAMCTLLAINTASITLIPTTVIAIRMQYHSQHPTAVVSTTLVASAIGTAFAIVLDRVFRRFSRRRRAA
ncbi:nucleoside recognition domain-containing protein [Alicyclobacillus fastidiosus]|uniref:Nucleoside recognition domain-containing protein n=1 Tax=Alicyclobacillus fastidiosus TaxID=392011 RepID=A0ABV5AG25_9BACL|nr:nucleoside recognition domain-containing protein [Alicyclobacillus fastidiosus]WEH11776.1 nucleoside recognition domain-containing protein [Alicyclobacillus fastidiosus]